MNIEVWVTFVIASIVLLALPGPTIITVIGYSVSHGYKAKIPLILAVAFGDCTALTLSLVGLGTLLAESSFWFQMVKWIGGLYLLYLGAQLFMAGVKPSTFDNNSYVPSSWKIFTETYLVTALNPKGIIFFIAFMPQFINTSEDIAAQTLVLSVTFVILASLNATLYAIFSGKAKQVLSSKKAQKKFNIFGGALLSSAGIWALSAKQ